ncbi:MAG: hypothetical protein WCM93_13045 [Bacteroidota bacterium]
MEAKTNKPQLFKPGEGGRPKGVKNKVSREQKAWVEWVMDLAEDRVEESIAKLKPKELIDMCLTLQEFVRPKLQRVNLEVGAEDKAITKITFELVDSSGKSLDE